MSSNLNPFSCVPWLLTLLLLPAFRPAGHGVELTNAVQVRQLALTEAKESQPVRCRAW
jgi:hypothetical protein